MNIDSKVRQGFRHLLNVQGKKHIVEFTELLNTFFVLLPDKVAKIQYNVGLETIKYP